MPRTAAKSQTSNNGRARSRSNNGVDRRELLLDAATELFASRPYESVGAEEIAARAGVAHGLLFHYFTSKRGIYLAAFERDLERSREALHENDEADPARWLRKEVGIFFTRVDSRAQMAPALFHGVQGVDTDLQELANRMRTAEAERVLAKLAPKRGSALLSIAINTWVVSCMEFGVQWVETGRTVSQATMRKLLIANLNDSLRTVAALDRKASFDPETFAGA